MAPHGRSRIKFGPESADENLMRPVALSGLVASLALGAVTVSITNDHVASSREAQDRALHAAASAQTALIEDGQRQTRTGVAVMLANPLVGKLLAGGPIAADEGARAARDAALALQQIRRMASVPIAAACLTALDGRQLACDSGGGAERLTPAAGRALVALAGRSEAEVVSNPFFSPLTGGLAVALVIPARSASRLLGVVHLDLAAAETRQSDLIVGNTPGAHVELAAYEGRTLQLNNQAARLTPAGISQSRTLPVRAVQLGSRPTVLVDGGHRVIVAPMMLSFGSSHEGVAAVATALGTNPSFFDSWTIPMLALAALALLLLCCSLAVLLASYRRMARDLTTDRLTGLYNRRRLMGDLEQVCHSATVHSPARLWLFDLNGFKRYNDAFGRSAGDHMLERLAERLSERLDALGSAYRIGGDEFCVLVRGHLDDPQGLLDELCATMSEQGGAFDISCSAGAVAIPRDTAEAAQALLLADQRMYQDKAARGIDTTELVTAVLSAALAQRHPDLEDHSDGVAEEVELLSRAVGLGEEALALVSAAASLHDVGKLGVPDEIITKPGPLDDQEWEFIKQHTLIGERIIAAAGLPMEGIGALVRSSHERWDGSGYPDGLTGETIPLGARIITICDAYGAMIAERVYKPPMTVQSALAELKRCAGTQFDPRLVELFCRLIVERAHPSERLRGAVG